MDMYSTGTHQGLLSEFVRAVFSIGPFFTTALPVDPARNAAVEMRGTVRRQRYVQDSRIKAPDRFRGLFVSQRHP
jgi:hypothetical protein